ncbi:MAG: hypothetical protein VX610_01540 [SAR324 cluster bacterium]|nr:hypothetical protein [SAR324 cluster bacterium]
MASKPTLRLLFLGTLAGLLLVGCTKPVYTEFFAEQNHTMFTTHPVKVTTETHHELEMVASRQCPGRTLCASEEIKFELTQQQSRFAFLKGKDYRIKADSTVIDLNHRDYQFTYDQDAKAEDGLTGLAKERWLVWLSEDDFVAIAQAQETNLLVGPYRVSLAYDLRDPWRILMDHPRLIETMEDEQKRAYVEHVKAPATEANQREKYEKRASTEAEEATWKLIKDSEDARDLRFFIEQYPDSPYTVPAKLRLKQLERKQGQ